MDKSRRSHLRTLIQVMFTKINPDWVFGRFWSEFWLKHVNPNSIFRLWFTLPFNGQARRLFLFFAIANEFKPTIGIETGTFYGSSTYLFLGVPTISTTYSIESNIRYLNVAKGRFGAFDGREKLRFIHGDSKTQISFILKDLDPRTEKIACYLDAHWEGDVPTIDEIRSLVEWGGAWFAVIDDFFVSGDFSSEYGFDSYKEQVVGVDLFSDISEISVLVPSESSQCETGARRGTGYFFGGPRRIQFARGIATEYGLRSIRE